MSPSSSQLVAICFVLGIVFCHGTKPNVQHEFYKIPEGSSGQVRFSNGVVADPAKKFSCSLSVDPSSVGEISIAPTFISSPDGLEVAIEVTAIPDNKLDGLFKAKIIAVCDDFKFTITQRIEDTTTDTITGDPHFVQTVTDIVSGDNYRVCYDVSGTAGDHIEIYKSSQYNVLLEGVLKDDYYMHIINIFAEGCNVRVSTSGIQLNGKSTFDWSSDTQVVGVERNNVCMLRKSRDTVEVIGFHKELFGGVDFVIKRSSHAVTGHFLDVSVQGLYNYEKTGGLLGTVGSNKFKFYKSVQVDSTSRGTVVVNGLFTTAIKLQREGLSCWLLDTKDIVHPYPISNFVFAK